MANTPNQKLKQLYLMKILMEQTYDEHRVQRGGFGKSCVPRLAFAIWEPRQNQSAEQLNRSYESSYC